MTAPLRIAYLMEDTDLSGGVRVQLAQADALIARGHRVTIFTKGLPLTWRTSEADWEYVDDFRAPSYDEYDFVIATFWTTVGPAFEKAGTRAIHLSQGLESTFSAYESVRDDIERAYRLPIPKLVVSPHLAKWLAPLAREIFVVGQIVDDAFYRDVAGGSHDPPRVLLAGPAQVDVKGIDVGYGAVLHARANGAELDLIRVSPWAPAPDEPKEAAAEFHVALDTARMAKLLHSCDVLLAPSRKEEGFGLPAAEAMAAGVPCALTRIPSFLAMAPGRADYAVWADPDQPIELGEQLMRLVEDEDLREALAIRGRQVATQYRAANAAERLEAFLLERRERLRRP
jgi:glycosyltransferase involved in cell wall biosynthesis